jgi:hypothetical protein
MEIPKDLNDEIWDYCRINKIMSIDEFTLKLIRQGFTIEKYGATPEPKEKIIEKIVEVPVEKIVEKVVEKIVEVPVEMVDNELSEKLRLKIIESEDLNSKLNESNKANEDLKNELETIKSKLKRDIYGER